MRVAILANEFFMPGARRVGGFAWLAREASRALRDDGFDVGLLTAELNERDVGADPLVDGTPLIPRRSSGLAHLRDVRRSRPDVVLSIDYRANYRRLLALLPRTPLVVWALDPRPPAVARTISTLRLPDREDVVPGGAASADTTSLGGVARLARLVQRPMRVPTPAPATVAPLVPDAFRVAPSADLLPYPLPPLPAGPKATEPAVAFLARMDPYKRPWLFVELARRLPRVRFLAMGEAYVRDWTPPADLPPNLELLGMVDGEAKHERLAAAWALVNTSIHEGLPVSFLEALAHGTPIVSCRDPEGIVSRFGRDIGRFDGSGMQGLDAFERGLREILDDDAERERIAREAPRWVAGRHSPQRFAAAFREIVADMGVAA